MERRATLRRLRVSDPPERWRALGFAVNDGLLQLGQVTIELGCSGQDDRGEITGWGLRGLDDVGTIDGLATELLDEPAAAIPPEHPNGAVGLDHVVVTTPDFDRTSAALAEAGLELRRVREAPGGVRQGFRRLGPAILELVAAPGASDPTAPARFWGLVVIVSDLDALAARLGERLGPVKDAVQPGRRIATLRSSAGLGPATAFMTPEPG